MTALAMYGGRSRDRGVDRRFVGGVRSPIGFRVRHSSSGWYCKRRSTAGAAPGSALLGTLAGAGVFLIFYLLGGMGGGDVKLMAGFGALLGCEAASSGGPVDGRMWRNHGAGGHRRRLDSRLVCAQENPRAGNPAATAGQPGGETDSIPYAPAIAAGVWLSLVGAT